MSKSKGFFAGVIVTVLAGAAAYAAYKTVKRIEEEKNFCQGECEDCDYYEDCYGDCCDCCSDSAIPDEEVAYCDCKPSSSTEEPSSDKETSDETPADTDVNE